MATSVHPFDVQEPSPKKQIRQSNSISQNEFEKARNEFNLMLRYILSEGLEIDDKTRPLIAAVQQDAEPEGPSRFDKLMQAHGALSKVIAPATPLSLEATEPAPGWFGSLRRPPLVRAMIIVAVIAAVGFVYTSIEDPQKSLIVDRLNWMFAAALGAVFYVLFTAHGFVKDRTFDPRYNSLYVIRFFLGVLAGLILAIVLEKWRPSAKGSIDLGPAVIALLGGFSTEAVYQILQRLVEILLAAVRGDDSDRAKAKASQRASTELLALADDPTMPQELKSKAIAAAKKLAA
jgi:hypothetical protein